MSMIVKTLLGALALVAAMAGATELVDGEVRRVDTEARKLTLRHAPIPNLGMSAMTMVFQVADPKLLEGLKPGDRVRFRAERVGGQFTVVAVEVAP
jgi:Cu(I)/Ag(I) efflux system protein CusF